VFLFVVVVVVDVLSLSLSLCEANALCFMWRAQEMRVALSAQKRVHLKKDPPKSASFG
jgi:hypothetical protein